MMAAPDIDLLDPKEVTLPTRKGEAKTYIFHAFPCVAGREICCKYPLSSLPKLGDYAVGEETMFKLMNFVAVPQANGGKLRLSTRALVENHVPDWETLARIEVGMLEYNCSFLKGDLVSTFFDAAVQKAQLWITPILTDLLGRSSRAARRRCKN